MEKDFVSIVLSKDDFESCISNLDFIESYSKDKYSKLREKFASSAQQWSIISIGAGQVLKTLNKGVKNEEEKIPF